MRMHACEHDDDDDDQGKPKDAVKRNNLDLHRKFNAYTSIIEDSVHDSGGVRAASAPGVSYSSNTSELYVKLREALHVLSSDATTMLITKDTWEALQVISGIPDSPQDLPIVMVEWQAFRDRNAQIQFRFRVAPTQNKKMLVCRRFL